MIYRGPEIQENVAIIWERLRMEVQKPTIKISKKRLLKASSISSFLRLFVKRYVNGSIREGEKELFLISVGILIGIFQGTSKSEKISENLRKLRAALTGMKLKL